MLIVVVGPTSPLDQRYVALLKLGFTTSRVRFELLHKRFDPPEATTSKSGALTCADIDKLTVSGEMVTSTKFEVLVEHVPKDPSVT